MGQKKEWLAAPGKPLPKSGKPYRILPRNPLENHRFPLLFKRIPRLETAEIMTGESTLWMRYLSTKKGVKTGGFGGVWGLKSTLLPGTFQNLRTPTGARPWMGKGVLFAAFCKTSTVKLIFAAVGMAGEHGNLR